LHKLTSQLEEIYYTYNYVFDFLDLLLPIFFEKNKGNNRVFVLHLYYLLCDNAVPTIVKVLIQNKHDTIL